MTPTNKQPIGKRLNAGDLAEKYEIEERLELADLLAAADDSSYGRNGPSDGNAILRRAHASDGVATLRDIKEDALALKDLDMVGYHGARQLIIADWAGAENIDAIERALTTFVNVEERVMPLASNKRLAKLHVDALFREWQSAGGRSDRQAFRGFVHDALKGRRDFAVEMLDKVINKSFDNPRW